MKRWKDACDGCHRYQYDCHSYYLVRDKQTMILCPECAKKMGFEPKFEIVSRVVRDVRSNSKYMSNADVKIKIKRGLEQVFIDPDEPLDENFYDKIYYNGGKEKKYFYFVRHDTD